MADFTLMVGAELKIKDVLYAADGLPGAAYNEAVEVLWVNTDDTVVQVMHSGGLNGKLKGISPGVSTLTVTVTNLAGAPITASSNITIMAPPRDAVRAELMVDE